MQPIVVRAAGEASGRFELVAGERRWRAAKIAGLEQIPALVRDLDDQQLAEWALIENLQREDLNPIERAEAFARLGGQFAMSHEQIATRVGLDRSTVSNLLRLLTLAEPVQQLLRDDLLSMGQARALVGVADAGQQKSLAKQAVREGLSVRAVEQAARRLALAAGKGDASTPAAVPMTPRSTHFKDLEQQIGEQIGTRVAIRTGRKKGTGRLTIEFYSVDQFDALLNRLGVTTD